MTHEPGVGENGDLAKIGMQLFNAIARELVEAGEVDPTGKSSVQLPLEVSERIRNASFADWSFRLDHRDDLLRHARRFAAGGRWGLACTQYATWTEHQLNWVLVSACELRRVSRDSQKQILRNSIAAKVSWLVELLDLPAIAKNHRAAIMKAAEVRNAFVHYKWEVVGMNDDPGEEKRARGIAAAYPKTVRYMRAYEHRILRKGMPARL